MVGICGTNSNLFGLEIPPFFPILFRDLSVSVGLRACGPLLLRARRASASPSTYKMKGTAAL